jgi:hypothetical protein
MSVVCNCWRHVENRCESRPQNRCVICTNVEAGTHEGTLVVGGGTCRLTSNSETLVRLICGRQDSAGAPLWHLHVEVDETSQEPAGAPYFRGMAHAVSACFGGGATVLFDVLRCRAGAHVSSAVAHDERFWRQTLLPIAAGVLGAAIGVLPVHSACLCAGDEGVLVAGISGTGKSTLALALAQAGMEFLADDWSYCRMTARGVEVAATEVRLKLLPDAVRHFPELRALRTAISMNGEEAYEFDPAEVLGVTRRDACLARAFVFYRRSHEGKATLEPISLNTARAYLDRSVETLPPELLPASSRRSTVMGAVAALPCWQFCSPAAPAEAAAQFIALLRSHDLLSGIS